MSNEGFTAEEARELLGARVALTTPLGKLEAGTQGLVEEAVPTPAGWQIRVSWYDLGPLWADPHEAVFVSSWFSRDGFERQLKLLEEDNQNE